MGVKRWPAVSVLLAIAVNVVSVFLPLYSAGYPGSSTYITDSGGGVGKFVISICAFVGIWSVATILTKKRWLSILTGIVSILSSIVLALVNSFFLFSFNRIDITPGQGMILLFVGAGLLFICGIIMLATSKKQKIQV
ncbi:hypothetical protein [Candidatus Enterococcus mansonii]|uniref:Uncharacterized protein n=1 Tax=Candidatus Enterococcus mansonii TaxID=1834181 RepID=A0A242CCR5_9ENTE|nr:hypothetical protein [Enterococcus sp. 4G2_DIV0659]OTO08001.1 hypothetical protein A5880_002271 [Enterococcus sp. 4G2_DIV0659]